MLLIGQYDSPFVRRVAIAMTLQGVAFEHSPLSVYGDAEALAKFNPLRRVPTLVLDDGETLIESYAILDYLDDRAGERRLFPASGPARREALRLTALAIGCADKGVTLVYELVFHPDPSAFLIERNATQIREGLAVLEGERAARASTWLQGEEIGHADIALGCVLRFLGEAHGERIDMVAYPALMAHSQACEALPAFRAIQQPFFVTLPKADA